MLTDNCLRIADLVLVVFFTHFYSIYLDSPESQALMRVLKIYMPLLVFFIFPSFGMYKSWRNATILKEIQVLIIAWSSVLIAFNIIILLLANEDQLLLLWPVALFKVGSFLVWAFILFILLTIIRVGLRLFLRWIRKKGYNVRKFIVVGAGRLGQELCSVVANSPWMGYKPIGFFDDNPKLINQLVDDIPVVGTIDDLPRFLENSKIDIAFIAISFRHEKRMHDIMSYLDKFYGEIKFIPNIFSYIFLDSDVSDFGSLKVININKVTKRWNDIIIATILLIVFSPILFLVALLIMIFEGRPFLYTSERFVKINQLTRVYKFRSMVRDANSEKYDLTGKYMRDGYLDIPFDAEVYTTIGRILERTQIVELPQLINILYGHMSFIGNRPLPKNNIEILKEKAGWEERYHCPTGLTGITQVVGKLNLDPDERLDLERMYASVYKNGHILICDLYILYRTFLVVLFGKGLPVEKAKWVLKKCGAK